ncbi:hypothetical protein [Rathayibacter tanaceti]|uniref:Uncharacterized protein n=2 Tax=Rathayibacter tanaceti TaxID=1671680 RepID=A0A162J2F7_9MICO|nr:hypothetical protein ACH61_01642 [Rathayibacter tanaceti]QHC56814.1 hypothetical protein GSU10_15040 [Rathayibacter tanaceti]TCO37828.1 hypothetical protein EV639_10312 [Rathayibacter tanaceti]
MIQARENFGKAAAIAWLLFLLIVLLGLLNFAVSRRIASVENRVAARRSPPARLRRHRQLIAGIRSGAVKG